MELGRAVLACRVVEPDQWRRRCWCEGAARDTVVRRLAHEPLRWRPTTLEVRVRRYRCAGCGHVWLQDTSRAAEPRAKLSRRGLRWALEGLVVGHLTVARIAEGLGVSWNTANDAVGTRLTTCGQKASCLRLPSASTGPSWNLHHQPPAARLIAPTRTPRAGPSRAYVHSIPRRAIMP